VKGTALGNFRFGLANEMRSLAISLDFMCEVVETATEWHYGWVFNSQGN